MSLLDNNDKESINKTIENAKDVFVESKNMNDDFSTIQLPSSQDNKFKPDTPGDYQIRIISTYYKVDKWWAGQDGEWNGKEVKAGRPYLYTQEEGVPMSLVKMDVKESQDGSTYEKPAVNNGYAWLIIDKQTKSIKVWEVFQKGLLKDLQKLQRTKENLHKYDMVLTREGTGFSTRWSLTPLDTTPMPENEKQLVRDNKLELKTFFNKDSFNNKAKIDRLAAEPMKNKVDVEEVSDEKPF